MAMVKSLKRRIKWKLFQARLVLEDFRSSAFDRQFNVETAREEPLRDVGVPANAIARGNSVYRVTWGWLIKKAILRLDIDPREFSFIDYGSGKGKAMLMAADLPFKSIVGVEYAKRLYEIAVQNCRTYRSANQRCQSLQPILGDVLDYAPPPGPTVFFMCNPFDETTLRAVFNIWRSRYQRGEGDVRILFLNMRSIFESEKVISEQGWLVPLARNRRFVLLAPTNKQTMLH
jgi:hypothetical protein